MLTIRIGLLACMMIRTELLYMLTTRTELLVYVYNSDRVVSRCLQQG